VSAADEMYCTARELFRASALLHAAHQDHAALICAIHSGINSADAIGIHEGDPYRGMEHRAAADHLRQLDIRLRKPAQALRRLVDRKSTAEYRQARYTRHQVQNAVGDARLLVHIAASWIEYPSDESQSTELVSMGDLMRDIEREAAGAGLDVSQPPWNLTLALLGSPATRGVTMEEALGAGE